MLTKSSKKEEKPKKKTTEKKDEPLNGEVVIEKRLNEQNVSIVNEMESSYIDYAMSVIVQRALPDVRDGLKPVHRRILFAMWSIGLKSSAKFRKSATVVGEVLGKYHPHGDQAVYDSMARMAQDFSMRYMLVHGQGNFGSMDGDRPAAMRYTEAKLRAVAEELLFDLEKDTVNFIPNYDGTIKEPQVLPAKLPNLLLNGTMGIAVGMATKIPPHNLTELCDGIVCYIDNPECTIDDLMEHVKGPDFPTGGIIYDIREIKQAYTTGKGKIVMRGETEIVEEKNGQFRILISSIPYLVNKATLLEKIAELVKTKKLDGVKDVRDESDKDGVRVVIELKRDAFPKKVLNRLFKLTQLQSNFDVNILALVDNGLQPKVLNLRHIIGHYVKHRKEVVRRRTEFELRKAEERAHILEGLHKAIGIIDAVIKLIKKSKDKEVAKNNLMKQFKFSEIQSVAILEMRLQNLANLERLKIEAELKEKKKLIAELKSLLASEKQILGVIKKELIEIKEKFGDERRTRIIKGGVGDFSQEDLVPNEGALIAVTKDGYIKRMPLDTFKAQHRGGKGVIGLTTKEEDSVEQFFTAMTHNDLLFFTSRGRVFKLKAYEIPVSQRTAKGQALVNFLQLSPDEKVTTIVPVEETADIKFMVMLTEQGVIKKTPIEDFANVRRSGLIAIKLKPEDRLRWVRATNGNQEISIMADNGQSIRFEEKDVRSMGRAASGVRGMRLKSGAKVVGMGKINPQDKDLQVLVITENGYGKRTDLKHYKVQNRGGSGVRTCKISSKTGKMVNGFIVDAIKRADQDVIIISQKGQVIRLPFKSINDLGRDTQGVRLMRFREANDKVANLSLMDIVEK